MTPPAQHCRDLDSRVSDLRMGTVGMMSGCNITILESALKLEYSSDTNENSSKMANRRKQLRLREEEEPALPRYHTTLFLRSPGLAWLLLLLLTAGSQIQVASARSLSNSPTRTTLLRNDDKGFSALNFGAVNPLIFNLGEKLSPEMQEGERAGSFLLSSLLSPASDSDEGTWPGKVERRNVITSLMSSHPSSPSRPPFFTLSDSFTENKQVISSPLSITPSSLTSRNDQDHEADRGKGPGAQEPLTPLNITVVMDFGGLDDEEADVNEARYGEEPTPLANLVEVGEDKDRKNSDQERELRKHRGETSSPGFEPQGHNSSLEEASLPGKEHVSNQGESGHESSSFPFQPFYKQGNQHDSSAGDKLETQKLNGAGESQLLPTFSTPVTQGSMGDSESLRLQGETTATMTANSSVEGGRSGSNQPAELAPSQEQYLLKNTNSQSEDAITTFSTTTPSTYTGAKQEIKFSSLPFLISPPIFEQEQGNGGFAPGLGLDPMSILANREEGL